MVKRRAGELLLVFFLFLALGVSWLGVLPLWQGPDEPAHFAYAQYMAVHVLPPVELRVAPGRQAWVFSPSPAESASIAAVGRNRILTHPHAWLSVTPQAAARAARGVAAASAAPGGNLAGSQNYVGIYPPLYYAAVGRIASALRLESVFAQAFAGRFVSAALLGLTGVLLDLVVGLVVCQPRRRVALAAAIGLMFPTLGMLGGAVTNDLMADGASLAVFYLAMRAVAQRSRLLAGGWFGLAAGLALWTKEEAYVALGVSAPFVLVRVWQHEGVRRAARWTAGAAGLALLVGGPWLAFTWHAYHALVPPLTYQGAGADPRTVSWVVGQQLLNGAFVKNVLLTQTVFGIDFPWWFPWPHHQWVFAAVGWVLALLLAGGLLAARRTPGVWLALAWLAAGAAVLASLQIQYAIATGSSFLQGRYFFFLLGPLAWLAAHALKRWGRLLTPLLLAGAAVLSAAVMNATLLRYYHAGLGSDLAGRVVMFGPPAALAASRVALSVAAVLVLGIGVAAAADRGARRLSG